MIDEIPIPEAFTRRKPSSVLSLAITALVVPGLFATVALPAYAYSPPADTQAIAASAAIEHERIAEAQTLEVPAAVPIAAIARDGFTATTPEELAAANAAAAAATAAGSSSFLANPPLPSFSLDQVASIAMQYQGVPYVFGGADPSGFDCSGFVMYVYAQVGISLPHGSGSQAAMGTAIPLSAALPGDVVIMDGHDGFYMGNGMILDAPQEGQVVHLRSIWTDDYYIVRFGI